MIIQTAKRLKQLKEYYFSVKLKEIKALQDAGKDIINLGIGSPDLNPSHETILTLVSSAIKKKTMLISHIKEQHLSERLLLPGIWKYMVFL